MASNAGNADANCGKGSAWKTKWAAREPRNEEELRDYISAFVEYLEERYALPPRGELESVTRI